MRLLENLWGATVVGIKIFISHAAADETLASDLVDCLLASMMLRAEEVRCTSVQGHKLPLGSETATVLRDELDSSAVVVVLLTPNALSSGWVLFELGAAWGGKKNPIPLMVGNLGFDDLPGPLRGSSAVRLTDRNGLVQMIGEVAEKTGTQKQPGAKIDATADKLVGLAQKWEEEQSTGQHDESSAQLLDEIESLRTVNQQLQATIAKARAQAEVAQSGLAQLDDPVQIAVTYSHNGVFSANRPMTTTWGEVFTIISPALLENPNSRKVSDVLGKGLVDKTGRSVSHASVKDQDLETIQVQFLALKLIKVYNARTVSGGVALFWSLTEAGHALMLQLRTVKKKP